MVVPPTIYPTRMARILYIFPHPDDESFGPAPVLARQRREGHDVYLLTLTRGEATSQRQKYGYTKEEMGTVRFREMQCVARTLDLSGLTVFDYPDGHLDAVPADELGARIAAHIESVRPQVVVTYAEHGISGHPDHLVTHAVVRRVYGELRARGVDYLQRLALFTISENGPEGRPAHLQGTPDAEIDCVVPFEPCDRERAEAALDCYETYQDVIARHQPLRQVARGVSFVLFEEAAHHRLHDLFEGLPTA